MILTVSYLKCFRQLVQLLPLASSCSLLYLVKTTNTTTDTHSQLYIFTHHTSIINRTTYSPNLFLSKKKSGKKRGFWSLGYDHQIWRFTFEPCNVTCSPLCNSLLRPFFSMWMDNWRSDGLQWRFGPSEGLYLSIYIYIETYLHINILTYPYKHI